LSGLKTVVARLRQELETAREHPTAVFGLPTGIRSVDLRTRGLHKGELTILAARSGHGKTALASQAAFHAAEWAMEQGRSGLVLFFEAEMPAWKVVAREVARRTGISLSRQLAAEYTDEQADEIAQVLRHLEKLPIEFDDRAGIHVDVIRETARGHFYADGVLLLVVDHLQLAASHGTGRQYEATTACIHALRELRDVIDAPVLVLSQLRRPQSGSEHSRPDMTDLRDSGSIEEDANNVYILYNPPTTDEGDDVGEIRPAELLIRKARDGQTGTIHLQFDSARVSFQEPNAPEPLVFSEPEEEDVDVYVPEIV
jgi:replicative DNA helicase